MQDGGISFIKRFPWLCSVEFELTFVFYCNMYDELKLRTTVPLVSYIRSSLRFWYYASISTCCQNLGKEIGVTRKIWEKSGVKLLRDRTEKSVNFSILATFDIRLLLVFGEEDQQMKLVQFVRKKCMITKQKLRKMTTF